MDTFETPSVYIKSGNKGGGDNGEEDRSVRVVCDVCAAHGERADAGVNVDTQGSNLREDETHFDVHEG